MATHLFDQKKLADRDIGDVTDVADESAAATAPAVDINHRRVARVGWLVLAVGFGGFLLW